MKIQLPATVKQKRGRFVSCCPILDVCSQGETEKKALKNLIEALTLFLLSCHERGTLDKVLRECGFEAMGTPVKGARAKAFPSKYKSISIPLPFNVRRKDTSRACLA